MDAWLKKFQEVIKTLPPAGTVLRTVDGSKAKLCIELKKDQAPFIYGRANVAPTYGVEPVWSLHNETSATTRGLKCVLTPASRDKVLGLMDPDKMSFSVTTLRVVRTAATEKSIVCELGEL